MQVGGFIFGDFYIYIYIFVKMIYGGSRLNFCRCPLCVSVCSICIVIFLVLWEDVGMWPPALFMMLD